MTSLSELSCARVSAVEEVPMFIWCEHAISYRMHWPMRGKSSTLLAQPDLLVGKLTVRL
jgi:hypothetical protein